MVCATIAVARMLGKVGYGELGMIRSTIGMFGVLAGFGLGITATKHVAEFRDSDPQKAGRIIGLSWLVAVITGGVMSLGLLLLAPWLAANTIHAPHLSHTLRIGTLFLFASAVNGTQTGALSGFEAFRTIAVVNIVVGIASFPMLVGGTWVGGLNGAVWALVLNLALQCVLNHVALRRVADRYHVPLSIRGSGRERSILWKYSIPAMISGMVAGPVFWACKSILANEPNGYAALGAVSAAESWRMIPLFLCTMIAQANLPIMAKLYGQGKIRQFKRALWTQFYLNGGIVTVGALLVVVFSRPIMASYGPEFRGDALVLILIILSTIPMQLTTVVGAVNRCMGTVWWNVLLNGLWAVALLFAAVRLVHYGAVGLAAAILAAYLVHFTAAMIYLAWALSRDPKLLGRVHSEAGPSNDGTLACDTRLSTRT
jgi:O-antigen/teichoic acid export membrane protein